MWNDHNYTRTCYHLIPCFHHTTRSQLCSVPQSCPTLCNPVDCSLPSCSDHGYSPSKNTGMGCHALLQESSQLRNRTQISWIVGGFFLIWAIREATQLFSKGSVNKLSNKWKKRTDKLKKNGSEKDEQKINRFYVVLFPVLSLDKVIHCEEFWFQSRSQITPVLIYHLVSNPWTVYCL